MQRIDHDDGTIDFQIEESDTKTIEELANILQIQASLKNEDQLRSLVTLFLQEYTENCQKGMQQSWEKVLDEIKQAFPDLELNGKLELSEDLKLRYSPHEEAAAA